MLSFSNSNTQFLKELESNADILKKKFDNIINEDTPEIFMESKRQSRDYWMFLQDLLNLCKEESKTDSDIKAQHKNVDVEMQKYVKGSQFTSFTQNDFSMMFKALVGATYN